jgi:uncharacterized protein
MARAFLFPLHDQGAGLTDPNRWPCISEHADGVQLLVQVVPNASHTACAGLHGDALRLRLAAPALEGRANAALLVWLAATLGLPRRAVRLLAGNLARRKRVALDCPAEAVVLWLERDCPRGVMTGPEA